MTVALVLALALLPLPTLLLALGAALALLLPLLDPIFGVYWAILSVPAQEVVHLPGGLSYTQAAMPLAAGAWALRALAHPERRLLAGLGRATAVQLFLWGALLWALLLATALSAYSRAEGLKETLRWAEAFLIWLMIVTSARRRWHALGLIACLLLAPAAEAAIGLAQFATGDGPPSFRIAPGLPFVRAYGTIGQPNSFAGYLNMAWPLALALAVGSLWPLLVRRGRLQAAGKKNERPTTDDRWPTTDDGMAAPSPKPQAPNAALLLRRWSLVVVLWLLASVLLGGLLASLSRGAWLGAAVGAAAMALAAAARLGRRALLLGLAAIGAGALALALGGAGLLPGFIAARLASITRYLALFDAGSIAITPDNFAVVERMSQMQAGWRMLLGHPLTGVGPGNYSIAYPSFAVGTWYASRGHAHNYYLHMAAEAGAIGLLAYLALLAGVSRAALAKWRRAESTFWRGAVVGCCGIIAAVAGHDLFENLHVLSMGIQLAGVWGLLAVIRDEPWQDDKRG